MKTVLLSGANRGLGLEFTKQYLNDGWSVIAGCRLPDEASELKRLSSQAPGLRIERLDLNDTKSIDALASTLEGVAIDLLINNAGIYSGSYGNASVTGVETSQDFGTLDPEAWERVLRINTIAPVLMIERLMSHLRKGSAKIVINITSQMGSLSEMGAGALAYRTSKAALNAAMRVISHDLAKDKITIVNLHPGWVQTDMGGKNAHLKPTESVSHLRRTIAALKSDDSGKFLNFDGKVISW